MSRKRGNGEGTISRRKNGGWTAQYYIHTVAGRKRKTLYGKTRAETAKKLAKALSQRADGLVFDDQGLTLGEYLDRWLADVEDTVRKSTHERYRYAVRPHLKPALGNLKLKDLTPAHVRWFYRERLDSGLAPASVHKLHAVLHKALKAAVADGLIPRNAASGIKLPRIAREEIQPLTDKQVRLLMDAARGDRLEALYVLALNTGMRQGELLALKFV